MEADSMRSAVNNGALRLGHNGLASHQPISPTLLEEP